MDVRSGNGEQRILVQVGAGGVRQGAEAVPLRFREAEIAVALAVQPHPVSAEFLTALLYPDRDPADANNMLNVYVYRLRRQVTRGFIVYAQRGYRLGAGVEVDAVLGRAALGRLVRADGPIDSGERDAMLQLARGLRAQAPALFSTCAWYEPVERVVRRLGRDLTVLLAHRAIEQGDLHEAIGIAQELTYEDACDEEAWELLIGTQLRLGRRAAALQGFRFYENALAKELAARPSSCIRRLVEEQRDALAM